MRDNSSKKLLGLIGFPLGHSFSKRYFTSKFNKLSLDGWSYQNFPVEDITMVEDVIKNNPDLLGFNVTIPHKLNIIPYLSQIDSAAAKIGAVNCVEIAENGELKGYNTDYIGFKTSLESMLNGSKPNALVLGTGGASRAVCAVLDDLQIEYKLVSRKSSNNQISYDDLDDNLLSISKLIINSTPLGMTPKVDAKPAVNYDMIGSEHYLYDLIFNPDETQFLKEGRVRGATIKNGYDMLVSQAEAWWSIIKR